MSSMYKESSSIFAETYGSLLGPALANAEDVANILDSNDGLTENFPMTGLGNRFRDIARVIAQREAFGLNRAVFFVQIGGFDTHGTLMRLPALLSEIDDAVGTFADEMKSQGIWEDVAVATMSDFGRTLTPNANPGTNLCENQISRDPLAHWLIYAQARTTAGLASTSSLVVASMVDRFMVIIPRPLGRRATGTTTRTEACSSRRRRGIPCGLR